MNAIDTAGTPADPTPAVEVPRFRTLAEGQRTTVWIADAGTGSCRAVLETDRILLEAPNWTADGQLLLNGDGGLWSLAVEVGPAREVPPGTRDKPPRDHPRLRRVPFNGLPHINNDHVLHPDGRWVLMSAADGHIYAGPVQGGAVRRMTAPDAQWHFLHGISPTGDEIAYVEIPLQDIFQPGVIVQRSTTGGALTRLDAAGRHCDGPEYSPDGQWIYLNTEAFTDTPGHAQLARYPTTGGPLEHLTASQSVDWFPHLAPVGTLATYVAFPAGTLGHPADVKVEVRVVDTSDWGTPLHVFAVPGGQGTLNVNSWAPDGRHFAFVSYPTVEDPS